MAKTLDMKGDGSRTINVRLPKDLGEQFDSLARQFPVLPKSVLLRLLLSEQFARPLPEQIELVLRQLRPSGHEAKTPASLNRIQGLNTAERKRRTSN